MNNLSTNNLIDPRKGRLFNEDFSHSLILTFNIDLLFYENIILKEFLNCGSDNNIILADTNQLLVSQQHQYKFVKYDASSYIFAGINTHNLFHPKAILLANDSKSKLFIGSGNITFGGLSANKEIYKEFSTENDEDRAIFYEFKSYVLRLIKSNHIDKFRNRIESALSVASLNNIEPYNIPNSYFIHNLDIPILEQIKEDEKDVKRIYVISPFFDKNLNALHYLKENISENINIYFQPTYTNFPTDLMQNDFQLYNFPDPERHLHAKIMIFEHEDSLDLLYGSPNCTSTALLEIAVKGNTEIGVFIKSLSKDMLDYYQLTNQPKIDINNIKPLQPLDSQDVKIFFIRSAYYSREGMLEIRLLKQVDLLTLNIFVNGKVIDSSKLSYNEVNNSISLPFSIPDNFINYVNLKINDIFTNTVIILNEQKDIYKTQSKETRAMNKLKSIFSSDSVEDIALVRAFDPFVNIDLIKSHEYQSSEDDNLDEKEKQEIENIKESYTFYVKYKDIAINSELRNYPNIERRSFVFDLLSTVPHNFSTDSPINKSMNTTKQSEGVTKTLSYIPEYKKFLERIIMRVEVLSRVNQQTKDNVLDIHSFIDFIKDFTEIIPLCNLLMKGITYSMADYDKLSVSFSYPELKNIILPISDILTAFWRNTLGQLKSVKELISTKYIVRLLSLTIGNLLLFAFIVKKDKSELYFSLNKDRFNFAFLRLTIELLKIIRELDIDLEMLRHEFNRDIDNLFTCIAEHYSIDINLKEMINSFITILGLLKEKNIDKSHIAAFLTITKNNANKSFIDQLNILINQGL